MLKLSSTLLALLVVVSALLDLTACYHQGIGLKKVAQRQSSGEDIRDIQLPPISNSDQATSLTINTGSDDNNGLLVEQPVLATGQDGVIIAASTNGNGKGNGARPPGSPPPNLQPGQDPEALLNYLKQKFDRGERPTYDAVRAATTDAGYSIKQLAPIFQRLMQWFDLKPGQDNEELLNLLKQKFPRGGESPTYDAVRQTAIEAGYSIKQLWPIFQRLIDWLKPQGLSDNTIPTKEDLEPDTVTRRDEANLEEAEPATSIDKLLPRQDGVIIAAGSTNGHGEPFPPQGDPEVPLRQDLQELYNLITRLYTKLEPPTMEVLVALVENSNYDLTALFSILGRLFRYWNKPSGLSSNPNSPNNYIYPVKQYDRRDNGNGGAAVYSSNEHIEDQQDNFIAQVVAPPGDGSGGSGSNGGNGGGSGSGNIPANEMLGDDLQRLATKIKVNFPKAGEPTWEELYQFVYESGESILDIPKIILDLFVFWGTDRLR